MDRYAIVSADIKSDYKNFWGSVSVFWKEIIGITPVLFLISDKDTAFGPTPFGHGLVKEIKAQTDNLAFESQVVRLFGPKYFPDDVCIISDIDMYPLSNMYFNTYCDQVNDSEFLVMSSDAYGKDSPKYPMCYNIAKGQTFIDLFKLDTYELYIQNIRDNYKVEWSTDELYLYDTIKDYENLKLFNRKWNQGIAERRIDRVRWGYDIQKLKSQHYIDCHALRPYMKYKEEIKNIYKELYSLWN